MGPDFLLFRGEANKYQLKQSGWYRIWSIKIQKWAAK